MGRPQNLRRRHLSDTDSEEEDIPIKSKKNDVQIKTSDVVFSIRELQAMRKRPAGVSLDTLNAPPIDKKSTPLVSADPFKIKTGGLVAMRDVLKKRPGLQSQEEMEIGLQQVFAAETNKRDEDAEMLKYIEEEMSKRKGQTNEENETNRNRKGLDLLGNVPDILKPVIGQQKEDMLSNQMLCGIPEVDLGVEAKMKNIEATEDAKQHLIRERFKKRNVKKSDELAPANISVNFVQHSRWHNQSDSRNRNNRNERQGQLVDNKDASNDHAEPKREGGKWYIAPLDYEKQRMQTEKATDSVVLQRFKNYMRDKKRR